MESQRPKEWQCNSCYSKKSTRQKHSDSFLASLEDGLHPYIGLGFDRNCKENLLDGAVFICAQKLDEEKLVLEIK